MTIPTDAEIQAAVDATLKEPRDRSVAIEMGLLAKCNPALRALVSNLDARLGGIDSAACFAALAAGLEFGLRIGEARAAGASGNQVRLYRFLNLELSEHGKPFGLCDRCKETFRVPDFCLMHPYADLAVDDGCIQCGGKNLR